MNQSGPPADRVEQNGGYVMALLKWALLFAIFAVIAALFGFTGVAAGAADVAKVLFFLFLTIVAVFVILGLVTFRAVAG